MKLQIILESIKTLIDTRDKWIQKNYGGVRDILSGGFYSALWSAPEANCFCLVGAKKKCLWDLFSIAHTPWQEREEIENKLIKFLGADGTLIHFNDTSTHAEVMEFLEKKIIEAALCGFWFL